MENSMSSGERELAERWSAKRKAEIVLRLLRGEDLGEISREIQVAPQVTCAWRRAFLSGAEAGLKSRSRNAEEQELVRTLAKLGETMMRLELAEILIEKRGFTDDSQEAQEMRGMVSPSTDRRYPLTMICSVFRTARSSVYAAAAMGGGRAAEEGRVLEKRGPKTTHSDAELLEEIRAVLEESSFLSEGHRKVWAMLRRRGIRVGINRVLRLIPNATDQ